MANEPLITIVGNLTADPELRFVPSGSAVANFTVASTPRVKDGDDWTDGEPMFVRCAVWRDYAENVAESLTKGARVIAQGRLKVNNYETRDGEKRMNLEMDVDAIGPDLRWAVAQVRRSTPGGGGQAQQNRPQQPQNDPWATPDTGRRQPVAGDPWAPQPPF